MGRFQFACGVLAAMLWVCVVSGAAYPSCDPAQAYQIGDGLCNEGFNNEACGYDGGDCCECTCLDSDLFECGTEGFKCLDPDAPCQNHFMIEEALDVRKLMETPTPSPSTSEIPTPSPSTSEIPTPSPSTSEIPTPSPSASETPTSSPSASSTLTTLIPTPSPSTSGDPSANTNMVDDSDDGGLSSQDTGIIVGCVIGALVVIGAVIFIRKRRGLARDATDGYYPPGTTRFA